MSAGDVVRCTLRATDGVRDYFNTWHYAQDSGSSTPLNPVTFSSDFIAAWTGSFTAAGCTNVTFASVTTQCLLGPSVGAVGSAGFPGGTIGTWAAADMPPEVAVNITRKIPKAGRQYRGRLFWGPCTTGMFTNAESGAVDSANARWTGLKLTCASTFTHVGDTWFPVLVKGTGRPVVYSRTPGYIQSSLVSGRNGDKRKRKDPYL